MSAVSPSRERHDKPVTCPPLIARSGETYAKTCCAFPSPLRERVEFLNERSEFRNSGEGGGSDMSKNECEGLAVKILQLCLTQDASTLVNNPPHSLTLNSRSSLSVNGLPLEGETFQRADEVRFYIWVAA